ncbi:RpiR family transcriptional regulator [Paramixta manurensis]|uniref:RpiR family transcriptional regulator n=1 Tax=Paramixta manurensis TaxID=2740817 RepID=A0A6M8UFF5_9GAMM|nr:RpiR family transcriptional regulator [Erwiniaceae bacterium PD-1]
MDIVWQLQSGLKHLPPQQTRVARFVLDNLRFSSTATLEELAAKAGVSTETLSVFARSVGCQDLDDFLRQLRALSHPHPDENSVQPAISGDHDYATTTTLEKLAAKAGIGPDLLKRFARSIGREDFSDILFQIRHRLNELSQQEARVARCVLEDVNFAASATIEQLATQAGVSPATITRFAKSVGCEDIRDLRMKLAQASAAHSRYLPVQETASALPAEWERYLSEVQQTLRQQLLQIPHQAFSQAATTLRQARSVHIFARGAQDSACAAQLQYQLMEKGIAASFCHEENLMRMTAATLNDDHALVVFASGTADASLQSAALEAHRRGLPIIAFTTEDNPLAALSHQRLTLPTSAIHARYGVMMTIDLLLAALA